jgi:hypothetical protein
MDSASDTLRESSSNTRHSEVPFGNNSSESLDVLSPKKEEKEKNSCKIVCLDKSSDIFVIQTLTCFVLKKISDFSIVKKIPFPKKLNTKKLLYDSHYVLKNNCLIMCMRGGYEMFFWDIVTEKRIELKVPEVIDNLYEESRRGSFEYSYFWFDGDYLFAGPFESFVQNIFWFIYFYLFLFIFFFVF